MARTRAADARTLRIAPPFVSACPEPRVSTSSRWVSTQEFNCASRCSFPHFEGAFALAALSYGTRGDGRLLCIFWSVRRRVTVNSLVVAAVGVIAALAVADALRPEPST